MVIGKVVTKFKSVRISTADRKEYSLEMTALNKLGIRILGLPHLGFRNRARIVFKLLKSINGKNVLDAGAGYGIYSFMLAEKGYSVSSLDYNKDRIHEIELKKKEYPEAGDRIETKVGSLTDLPYNKEKFDIIICSEVLEHIKQDKKAFSELARVLEPGGFLILSVPTNSKSNQKQYIRFEHERPGYSFKDIKELADKNKLQIKKIFFYEYSFGRFAFRLHNAIDNLALKAGTFYFFYALSFLDEIVRFGEADGMIVLLQKTD